MAASEFAIEEQTVRAFLGTTALLGVLLPATANAQEHQINMFWGEDASCAAWMKSASNKLIRAQYDFWVRGFASGHNYANPSQQVKVGQFLGSDELYRYLDQYCRDNPKSSFIGGAIQLVEQLSEPAVAPKKAPIKPAPAKKEPAKPAPASAK